MLGFMLQRLEGLPVDTLVVATSVLERDDAVVDVARRFGAEVVRGPEDDVLERYVLGLEQYPADAFVRLTADCPLIDPDVVRTGIERYRASGADHVSNSLVRTYPDGLDVEVVSANALMTAAREAAPGPEREHVTPFIYRRPERFRLGAFRLDRDYSAHRWTVDTEDDLAFVRSVVDRLDPRRDFGWQEILAFPARLAEPVEGVRLQTPAPGSLEVPRDVPTDDPGRRVWLAVDDRRTLGWARVDVRDAIGTLEVGSERGEPSPEDHWRIVRAVQAGVGVQVRELVRPVPTTDALVAVYSGLGFAVQSLDDGARLHWPQPATG